MSIEITPDPSATGPRVRTPRTARFGAALLVGGGLLVGAACSAPTEDSAAATADALAALDDGTRAHVEFEAAWQCDLTRFAFDDLDEIDVMRVEQLDAYGLTEDTHETFVTRLDTEPELADIVAELSADCAGSDVEVDGPVEL